MPKTLGFGFENPTQVIKRPEHAPLAEFQMTCSRRGTGVSDRHDRLTHRWEQVPFVIDCRGWERAMQVTKDLMQYERLAQDALRDVVRKSLERAAGDGLPGAHHFYITFRTTDPGCDIDESLASAYPEEMTIVLEHQFWDLEIDDVGFEVTLKFGGVPKYLKVPWRAVTRFHDPSVGFRLHFDYATPAPGDAPGGGSGADDVHEGTVVSLEAFRNKE